MPQPVHYLDNRDILDVRGSAMHLNRTPNFVRRVIRYEVPVIQHGDRGPLYFRRSDLDMWMARHTNVPVR